MQTTTRTRILPLSPHRSSTPGSRPPIDCSFALQKPSSALRPRSLAGHATGSAPEVSCNEKDALFCHRAYLFIWYYGQVFQGCPKRGTLVRWPGRSNQSLKAIPSLSWLRLLVSSTPSPSTLRRGWTQLGLTTSTIKEGFAMNCHLVSLRSAGSRLPPGLLRAVHQVPCLTICTTLRHVNCSRPRTTKINPKVWNIFTSLWTLVSMNWWHLDGGAHLCENNTLCAL